VEMPPHHSSQNTNMPLLLCPATAMNADAPATDDSVGFGDISRIARVEDIATTPIHTPRDNTSSRRYK
jgi:hypothetical protein